MKNSQTVQGKSGLKAVRKKTAWPIWGAAAVWLLALTILPMYKILHVIIYAVLSAAVWIVLDKLIPGYTVYVPEKLEKLSGIATTPATWGPSSSAMKPPIRDAGK